MLQALITTYELVLKDASILNHIKWNYMMVDEAHRLKNHESALYQEMTQFSFKNRLLITGQLMSEQVSISRAISVQLVKAAPLLS